MFERFSVEALRAVELARDEARSLRSRVVEPEHLLLGLVRQGGGVTGRVLASFGVDLDEARDEVQRLGRDTGPEPSGAWLGRRTKRILRASRLEVLRSGSSAVGAEHLLLALALHADPPLERVLVRLGLDPLLVADRLRAAMEAAVLKSTSTGLAPASRPMIASVVRRHSRVPIWVWPTTDAAATVVAASGLVFGPQLAGASALSSRWVVFMAAGWLLCLALAGTYDRAILGLGLTEFTRIGRASVALTVLLALAALATSRVLPLTGVVIAVAAFVAVTTAERVGLRRWLKSRRRVGHFLRRVVVVGHEVPVLEMLRVLGDASQHGLAVVAACLPLPGQRPALTERGIPVVGGFGSVAQAVRLCDANTVVVLASPDLGPEQLRRMAWDLERTSAELMVGPSLVDVAASRLSIRQVTGLPLLRVEQPRFRRARRMAKATFDRVAAVAAVLVLSPLLAGIAVAIRLSSRGPALHRQTRVGKEGKPFAMLKFRSMVVDAESLREQLLEKSDRDGILFKLHNDPRVTRVGAWLRRHSLDELPQLFNVVGGSMSLVGPRPPLPSEVAQYGDDVRRRLLVRPGITGPWQVGGRSDLSWEEAVRLDLDYIDNWTLATDLLIMWRTVHRKGRAA